MVYILNKKVLYTALYKAKVHEAAKYNGHDEIMKWLYKNGCPGGYSCQILDIIYQNNCPWDTLN